MMRIAFLSSLVLLAVSGLCTLNLKESDSPNILRLGLKRNHFEDPVGRDRRRFKRSTVDVDLYGYSMGGELYSTNLTLGTPPQRVEVSVDTGSSDLWAVHSNNRICSASGARCDSLGTYNPLISRTSDPLDDKFTIRYGDQSWADGYYAVDTLAIADTELPQVQFGVAITSSIDKGILGLGYSTNVVSRNLYTNFPELLVRNNITKSNAYSLWLNRLGEDEGNILFGGVNTAHFVGELQTLPVVPYNGTYVHLWITLTSMGVESSSDDIDKVYNPAEFPTVVLLDSGATISYLPADIVEQIYNDLDVHLLEDEQFGYVPCHSYLDGREDYNVTFTFSGLTIRVPLRELVLQDAIYYQGNYLDIDGEDSCIFGIAPSVHFFPILGDSFLRSAYVVFDLDNNKISMAQANFSPGEDHILEIGIGDNAVPEATPVQNPITTATVELEGTALSLPPNHTNEPIFPSTTETTSTVQASTTINNDPSLPTNTGSGGSSSDASGTPASPEETDLAVSACGSPSLLVAAAAGLSLLLGM